MFPPLLSGNPVNAGPADTTFTFLVRPSANLTLQALEPGVVTSGEPVTFTATDHRPMSLVRVYQVKNSKFNLVTEVDMKKLYPDEWANKWIGW